jgi:hypothetical protein
VSGKPPAHRTTRRLCDSVIWGGEVSLRSYPDRPGLPRKPSPRHSVSTTLNLYATKNANFLAFSKKPNLSGQNRGDSESRPGRFSS